MLERIGTGALHSRFALRGGGCRRGLFSLLTKQLLTSGALAGKRGHLCPQVLGLLPGPVNFVVRTIFGGAQVLSLGLTLRRSGDLLLLKALGKAQQVCVQSLAAGLQTIPLLGEIPNLLSLLLSELLDFSQTGICHGQRLLGRFGSVLLCLHRLLDAVVLSRQGRSITLQGLTIRRDPGQGIATGSPQRLLPQLRRQSHDGLRRVWQRQFRLLGGQASPEILPPAVQQARHRIRRAAAQKRPDPLDRGPFAGGDECIRRAVDLVLGNTFVCHGFRSDAAALLMLDITDDKLYLSSIDAIFHIFYYIVHMKNNELLPPIGSLPALLPDQLAASAADAVREILAEAASANTTRSYASALRYWAAWFQGRYGAAIALPVSAAAVVQFVVDHVARRSKTGLVWELPPALDAQLVAAKLKQRPGALKLSTVVHRVAVLSTAHQLNKADNPCEAPAVRHLLARGRRAAVKRGERPSKKTAIAKRELEALIATCDDSLEGIRDRALLYFAFASGGRRRSEVAGADLGDLRRVGERAYVYRLEHSKSQQAGPTATSTPDKPILGAAADALAAWLTASGLTEGPIFRRLWTNRIGAGLSPKAIAEVVQRRAARAGLEGDFGGHSLRSGFVTEGGRQGIALPAIMAMTEHRSVASVIGYFQAGGVTDNPAAKLLED